MMIDWRALTAVAVGAAAGGVVRYLIGVWTVARLGGNQAWLGTGLINVTGAFLIGIVIELAVRGGTIPPIGRLFLATGFLGGYTTFSTFAWETLSLALESSRYLALAYSLGSLILGVLAAFGGSLVARLALR
jgi:fluoride exporter